MRLLWLAILFVLGCAPMAQAQEAATPLALDGLLVSPKLELHKMLGDDEITSFLSAQHMERDASGKVVLSGSAQVRRIDAVVKGDQIDYQHETGQVNVSGNALIMRDGNIVRGPQLSYNLNEQAGQITSPDFWLGADGGAGKADKADILSRSRMRLSSVRYSGCPCENPAWYIESPKVDFDLDENEGVARNAVLYFKDVPILASPYLSFPLRKERKSGLLMPTYGASSNSGLEFMLPYYFNLAPNRDLTLTPRYMAKRGLQLGAEFRYLGESYNGQLAGTYLNRDKLTDSQRWMYWWQHNQRLSDSVSAYFDVRRVSDDDYFRDFTTFGLNEASIDFLPSIAQLSWAGSPYWQAHVQAYTYQTLQDRTAANHRLPPFNKLPELHVRGAHYNWGGLDVISDNYATKFSMPRYKDVFHPYPFDTGRYPYQSYDGTRLSSYNAVSYPIVRPGWYFTPKAALHLSQYTTNWNGFALAPNYKTGAVPGTPRTQSRAIPLFSLDTGLIFERQSNLFSNSSIQTLEPRLYYLQVPYHDQSSIPIFDTGLSTFNFSQVFDENLYSGGWDRIANAKQLTVGLTTRWLDEDSGFERLSLSAAQRIYFEDQKVTLPGAEPRTDTKSDYLFGANAALTDKLNVRFDAQFNPDSRNRNRMSAGVRWKPQRLALLAASYRYERDPSQINDPTVINQPWYVDKSRESVALSGQWPLSKKLYAMGRIDYSLQEKRSTQSILGLEYKGDCCWAARVVYQRYAVSAAEANTAVFFQLELRGLGSLGTDPMSMLSRNINGYQAVTPPIADKTIFERYE